MPKHLRPSTGPAIALGLLLSFTPPGAALGLLASAAEPTQTADSPCPALAALGQRLTEIDSTHLQTDDNTWAIAQLDAVIEELERLQPTPAAALTAAPCPGQTQARAYFSRARVLFEVGNIPETDADLERLLLVEPGFLPPTGIPRDLAVMFNRVRQDRVGSIELTLEPEDARVFVDAREVDSTSGPIMVYAGTHELRAERAGCRGVEQSLAVQAGQVLEVPLSLERVSAVVRLRTEPAGVRVVLENREVGITAAREADPDGGGLSLPFLIEELEPGRHLLETRKDGYRSRRFDVQVLDLKDYDLGTLELEPQVATVRLRKLPEEATVVLNGANAAPVRTGETSGLFRLPPGNYRILVEHRLAGIFERQVLLTDGDEVNLEVDFRTPLTLLAILGGDRLQADALRAELLEAGEAMGDWTLLDRSGDAGEALKIPGFGARALRASARGGPKESGPDWEALAASAEAQLPGSAFLIAVLDDDLYASSADLWFVPARRVMSPVRPYRRRIDLEDRQAIAASVIEFGHPFAIERSWLGALLIDSAAGAGPVTMAVTPNGPADKAGLRVGDEVTSALDTPLATVAELEAILDRMRPGTELRLNAHQPAGLERRLTVRLGSSPVAIHANDPTLNRVALLANLTAVETGDQGAEDWLVRLNQACALMGARAWAPSVEVLKTVKAPEGPGLGQAAADYWLAKALLAVSPTYAKQAKKMLESARAAPDARLYHNDGPLVAPRARALLARLGFED